ncbi:MAG: Cytotoxic translational repressor of toxin-antitoxin stability system, RelE family [Candidatus Methanohalarchaeum thermophilum]|uniref:Cytotoxic translational repressor of toxin-antitoxin stability system, RelE family n=1 Tax=Methanohalarchaeum thermophilum TaxID=1903181 RepID=A0A1Q6DXN9_METT1|nr:MAG: Cytotoxic translational repressor of toxin-antitoxin stability system, RelE family [Candidatus Methanohalarchaeum thermophilum]
MVEIEWTKKAVERLDELEDDVKERIREKVEDASDFPDHYLDRLTGVNAFKLRIGDYRVIVDWKKDKEKLVILTLGHRKDIYRNM